MADTPAPSHHRRAVAGRALAAILGNYVATSLVVAVLARILPMAPVEATATAALLSFAIFAGIAVAIFAAQSQARMWAWLTGVIVLLSAGLWLSIATAGRL